MNYKDETFNPVRLCKEINDQFHLCLDSRIKQKGVIEYRTWNNRAVPDEIFDYIKSVYQDCNCFRPEEGIVICIEKDFKEATEAASKICEILNPKKEKEESTEWFILGYEAAANKACKTFNAAIDATGELFGDKASVIKEQFKKCLFEDSIQIPQKETK